MIRCERMKNDGRENLNTNIDSVFVDMVVTLHKCGHIIPIADDKLSGQGDNAKLPRLTQHAISRNTSYLKELVFQFGSYILDILYYPIPSHYC